MNDFLDNNLSANQKRAMIDPFYRNSIKCRSEKSFPIIRRRQHVRQLRPGSRNCMTIKFLTEEYWISPLSHMHGITNKGIYLEGITLYDDGEVCSWPKSPIINVSRFNYPIALRSL